MYRSVSENCITRPDFAVYKLFVNFPVVVVVVIVVVVVVVVCRVHSKAH